VDTLRFEASPRIEIEQADGEAAISGWDQDTIELTLDGDADQCVAEQQEGILLISSHAALAINLPKSTAVHIGQVSGDLLVREIDGPISVDTAYGDVSLRSGTAAVTIDQAHGTLAVEQWMGALSIGEAHGDAHLTRVGSVQLGQIHGFVHARDVAGELQMGVVNGDVRVREVAGPLVLEHSRGYFQGQDLHGGLDAHQVGGDLTLKTAVTPGLSYRARATGQIRARFPADTSARFHLEAKGAISAQLPQIEHHEPGRVAGQAGGGEAEIVLHADGDLFARVQGKQEGESDAWTAMDSISAQIELEMAEHLGKLNVDAMTQREIDKAMRQAEKEIAKAQRELERETRRAEEQTRRAQERAARAARRAQEKVARKSRRWGIAAETGPSLFGPPPPPHSRPPKPKGPPAKEQLAVLKMLQEKKISPAEAEMLLRALEG
jgi:DUF4097 and DUF4098 domain-containing protein YvlB